MFSEFTMKRTRAKFVFKYLKDGIHEFQKSKSIYLQECIIFLQLFYLSYTTIPSVFVELTHPLCAAWTDQLIKRCLFEEIKYFGRYGCIDIRIEQCHVSHNRSSRPLYHSTSTYMPSHPTSSSHISDSPKVLVL